MEEESLDEPARPKPNASRRRRGSILPGSEGVIDVCMAAFSYSAVDRKEEGVNQSSPTRRPLPDLVPVERMDGDAGASAAIASKLAGGDVVTGAPQVSVEFGGINKDLFVSRGPGAPEEVFQDEINGGFRRESSGGSTDSEADVMMKPRPVHHAYIAHQHGEASSAFKSCFEDDASSSSMQMDMVDVGAEAGSKKDEGAGVEESTFSRKRGGDETPSMGDDSSDRLFDPFFSRKRSCESNTESDGRSVSPTIRHQNHPSRGGSAWSSNSHSSWGSVGPPALEFVSSSYGSSSFQTFQNGSGSSSPVFADAASHFPPIIRPGSASSQNRGSPVSRLPPDRNSDALSKGSVKPVSMKPTSQLPVQGGKTMMRRRSFTEQLAKGETLLNVDERWELKTNAGRGMAVGLRARQGSVEPNTDGTMPNSQSGLSSGPLQGSAPPCMPSPSSAPDKMPDGFLLSIPKGGERDSEGRRAS